MPATMQEIIKRWMEPDFKFFVNRKGGLKEKMEFLLEEERMKDEYLGACLDYIRGGFLNGTSFNATSRELINFIQEWMKLNKDSLIWSEEPVPSCFKLPHINYKHCPRKKEHKKTIKDLGGRLRCAETSVQMMRSSFIESYQVIDKYAMMQQTSCYEAEPRQPSYDEEEDEEEEKRYEREMALFDAEKPVPIRDVCYAVVSEPENVVLPLEKVINRLNTEPDTKTVYCGGRYAFFSKCKRLKELEHCPGHVQPADWLVFPFGGWELAWYVQKWHEQADGKAPVFNKQGDKDSYKEFPNFILLSSED